MNIDAWTVAEPRRYSFALLIARVLSAQFVVVIMCKAFVCILLYKEECFYDRENMLWQDSEM